MLRVVDVFFIYAFRRRTGYRVRPIITRGESCFIFKCQCQLRMERCLFPRGIFCRLLIRELCVTTLVRSGIVFTWYECSLFFVSISAVLRLSIRFPISFFRRILNQLRKFFHSVYCTKNCDFIINCSSFMRLFRIKKVGESGVSAFMR